MDAPNNEGFNIITEIITEEEFNEFLKLHKAILYFHVTWSGPELMSRRLLTKAMGEIEPIKIPVFKINASEQDQTFVKDWLLKQQKGAIEFYYGGSGETILMEFGKKIDSIRYPALLGLDQLKEKLKNWQKQVS